MNLRPALTPLDPGTHSPGFRCLHAHCEGKTIRDVRDYFGQEEVDSWCTEEWRPDPRRGGHRAGAGGPDGPAVSGEDAQEDNRQAGENGRTLPPPLGIGELLRVEEPEVYWLVEELIPTDTNMLLAGYPKTYKTFVLLELPVALATATPFLGSFAVPEQRRVGLVLMEDQDFRVRRRLRRLCAARSIGLSDLEGWLHLWFRPPLRLNNTTALELAEYAGQLDLDFLGVDSWAYVAAGNSDDSDDVTPQLQALSNARTKRPGLTVGLTHHARKDPGLGAGQRLTDIIRNSSAFGAWFDTGLVLARKDETCPVTVRAELRDHPAPDAFAFVVEDQDPAGAHNDFRSSGWLRLRVSDHRPEVLDRMAAAEKLAPAVREFLSSHPEGVSRTKLRNGVRGTNADIEAAFELLVELGDAENIPSPGPGRAAVYRLRAHPAGPCRNPAAAGCGGNPADPDPPPEGGERGQGTAGTDPGETTRQGHAATPTDPTEVLEEATTE